MPDLARVARNVVEVSLSVRAGEKVWIHGWDHTIELMSHLAWECRKLGCDVFLTLQPEDLWFRSMIKAPLPLLDKLPAQQAAALRETDVYIFTLGPGKRIPWGKISEERRKVVSIWLDTRYDRSRLAAEWAAIAEERKIRMLAVEATLATPERADAIGVDYEWREIMFAGCLENWHEVSRRVRALSSLIGGDEEVHITTPRGTDLRLRLDERPINFSDGFATEEKAEKAVVTFLPAGGIEVSADEESARGRLVYDVPIRSPQGKVEDLTLILEGGRIRRFSAKSGREIFTRYLENNGDVDRFASFGFGLNSKLKLGFTQDDKVLGGVTIGFGDNEKKGGKNRADGEEWWGALSTATVTVGKKTVMREGQLTI